MATPTRHTPGAIDQIARVEMMFKEVRPGKTVMDVIQDIIDGWEEKRRANNEPVLVGEERAHAIARELQYHMQVAQLELQGAEHKKDDEELELDSGDDETLVEHEDADDEEDNDGDDAGDEDDEEEEEEEDEEDEDDKDEDDYDSDYVSFTDDADEWFMRL
jgi:hypothetical protein